MSTILYEPLPAARLGVRPKDQTVVIATDYSTFAFMLEEFVSLAVTTIAVPRSAPEAALIANIPAPIRSQMKIIEDADERQAVDRALAPVFAELKVTRDSAGHIITPKKLDRDIGVALRQIEGDLWRLALGFNHGVQLGVSPASTCVVARSVRKTLRDPSGRAVLAQVEGILATYQQVKIDTPTIGGQSTTSLLNIFDRLVNDELYLSASRDVGKLAMPRTRRALSRLRAYTRSFLASSPLSAAWNAVSKVVNVWSGAPIPEAEALASIVVPRRFPLMVDLSAARARAFEMWKSSAVVTTPLDRAGAAIGSETLWLPPLASSQPSELGNHGGLRIGRVKELRDALDHALELMDGAPVAKGEKSR